MAINAQRPGVAIKRDSEVSRDTEDARVFAPIFREKILLTPVARSAIAY
jgi:hypothetical protein